MSHNLRTPYFLGGALDWLWFVYLSSSLIFSQSRFLESYKDRRSVVARTPGDGRFRESYFQVAAGLPPVDACAHHPMAYFPSSDFWQPSDREKKAMGSYIKLWFNCAGIGQTCA